MYDPTRSYEDNYLEGPFPEWCLPERRFPVIRYTEGPRYSLFGNPLHLPLGVPAGPLLNSRFVATAWSAGLSLCTYKTVRSRSNESHPHPNVLSIEVPSGPHELHPGQTPPLVRASGLSQKGLEDPARLHSLSISNSFGVPSRSPEQWATDVAEACRFLNELSLGGMEPPAGYGLILSFQGTRAETSSIDRQASPDELSKAFEDDAVRTQSLAERALEKLPRTCTPILEVNLSCPNEGGTPIYRDLRASLSLLERLKQSRSASFKLIAKIGSLSEEEAFAFVAGSRGLVDGLSSINTVSARILSSEQRIVLGSGEEVGGVCGDLIFHENMSMLSKLRRARDKAGLDKRSLALISVGGVNSTERVLQALENGADHVQAATACMWNLDLPAQVATKLGVPFRNLRSVNLSQPLQGEPHV